MSHLHRIALPRCRASALALGAALLASCSSIEPLRELSRSEQTYFQRLAEHLEQHRESFAIAVRNRWNEDVPAAQAGLERVLAENAARREALSLETQGIAPAEAWRIAGERFVVEQRRILAELERAQSAREQRIAELLSLYDALHASAAALAKNQAKLGEYLELSSLERLVTDVKGLDREELKRLGDELKDLRSAVEERRSES
ncbi:MAG: hypothetical protein JNM84_05150 [Planctomycetes bacterium]|nr:hypothetical protein [Planctomycetota bacterium]